MPSMGQYIYSTDREGIYVNLFIGSSARLSLKNIELKIIQVTDYPWEGKIELILDPSAETNFTVRIRIPGFNGIQPIPGDLYSFAGGEQGHPGISINGEVIDYKSEKGFALLDRKWKAGDKITVSMPMEIRQIVAREEVKADSGRIAFSRGPLVFCIEEIDNNKVRNISVGKNPDPKYEYRSDLLTGVGTIKFKGFDSDRTGKEYTAIPYFAWANRDKGEMIVWLKKQSNNRM
jgi:hypothetical protein